MKTKQLALGVALTLAVAAVGYRVGKARADGVPMMNPLFYSGTLEDGGRPVEGTRDITIRLWDAATGGTIACPETTAMAAPVLGGRFRVALGSACVMAIQRNPELWTEVVVGGTSLGRSKIGAVPYAVEAGRASGASGTLETRLATVEARSQPRQVVTSGPYPTGDSCSPSRLITNGPRVEFTAARTGLYRFFISGSTSCQANFCVGIIGISGYSGQVVSVPIYGGSTSNISAESYLRLESGRSYAFGVGVGVCDMAGFRGQLTVEYAE